MKTQPDGSLKKTAKSSLEKELSLSMVQQWSKGLRTVPPNTEVFSQRLTMGKRQVLARISGI